MIDFDFIALDFETATQSFDSACSIGLAMVRGMKIVDTFYSLIKPPRCQFDPNNIAIHGICPDDVNASPTLDDLFPKISQYFGQYAVLAHNARFDMSVLKSSCTWSSYIENFKYIDTVSLAKDFVPGHKDLLSCATFLGVPLSRHHNALSDAECCANIAIRCIEESGHSNLGSLCFALPNVKIRSFKDLFEHSPSKPHFYPPTVRPSQLTPQGATTDSSHPLYGKTLVFTGELSLGRKDAMQMAINAGAFVRTSVSKKTDYLVVGRQDLSIVGDDGMSGKEEMAHAINEAGQANIKIIDEHRFVALINRLEVPV